MKIELLNVISNNFNGKRLKVMDRANVSDNFKIPEFAMEYIQQTFFVKYAAENSL